MFKLVIAKYRNLKFARLLKNKILHAVEGIGQEADETKVMLNSFFRLLQSKLDIKKRKAPPTEEEIKLAIEQLKDIGKFSVVASIFMLPGGSIPLIGMELLAKKLGVKNFNLMPSAFKKKEENTDNKKIPAQ